MGRIKRNGMRSVTAPSAHEVDAKVGAEQQEDGSDLVDEETVRKLGAVNAEAARENERRKEIIDRKRGGEKRVPWGEMNAVLMYDDIVSLWPANTLSLCVTRLTGTPLTMYIYGYPRSGQELYNAIKTQVHGRREETEYSVTVRDAQSKFDKGKGRVTLPNTLDEAGPAQPPHAQAPAPPPQIVSSPAPGGYYAMPGAPGAAPAVYSADPVVQHLMRELAELRALVARGLPAAAPAAPAPAAAPPAAAAPVPVAAAAPPGQVYFVPGLGYVQSVAAAPQVQQPQAPPAAPPAPPTPQQVMAQSVGVITGMAEGLKSVQSIFPAPAAAAAATGAPTLPTQVIDLGNMKIVQNTEDGSLRTVETILANYDRIENFVSTESRKFRESRERMVAMQNGQAPAQQQQQQPQTSANGVQTLPAPTMPK